MEGENINTRTKRTSTRKLRSGMRRLLLWAAITVPALLASCSQEELEGGGTALPAGKYPLAFTAGVGEMQTRAVAGKDVWKENDAIGVRMGSGTEAAKYELKPDGGAWTARPADAANTLYWQSTAPADITAWYPYGEQGNVNISDQNKGFAGFDFLRAETKGASYNAPLALTFRHQMAKVTCVLTNDASLSDDEWKNVGVACYGATSATFTDGELKNGSDEMGWIMPQADTDAEAGNTHVALLVPQELDGQTSFIHVTATVGGTERDFYYTPTGDAAKIESGQAYTYNISVRRDGISVKQVTGGTWENGSTTQVASDRTYTADDLKPGDFIYTDGSTSDGGLRVRYADGTVKWAENKPATTQGKTVAGIVFWTPAETTTAGRKTPASLADDKVMAAAFPNCTHGLAVSLKEVSTSMMWQSPYEQVADFQNGDNFKPDNKNDFKSVVSGTGKTDPINYVLGYQNTQVLLAYNAYCTSNSKADYIVKPVAALADFTQKCPAPDNSTGWFLPSVKELKILCNKDVDDVWDEYGFKKTVTRDIVNTSLNVAGGDTLGDNVDNNIYWSSLERTRFGGKVAFLVGFEWGYIYGRYGKGSAFRVRAVCAF